MELASRKERFGWYFIDFASSAFSTTVVTVFLGPYLTTITQSVADAQNLVHLWGIPINADSWFPYCISLSVILQVLFLPITGSIADYTGRKKELLLGFSYIGAIATLLMFFIQGDRWLLGGLLFIIANLSYGVAIVLYNAYLNDIAPEDKRDAESSKGFAFGYVGGGILLALNLALFGMHEDLGLTTGMAVRICLVSAGLWWAIFMLFPLFRLKSHRKQVDIPQGENLLSIGFSNFWHTLKDSRKYPLTLTFLIAFLLYNDGVQTVISIASQYANKELGLELSDIMPAILMVQFVAFGGAFFFNYLSSKTSTKSAIMITLVIWTACMFYGYGWVRDITGFYILAAIVGFIMGGTQALSRGLFSRLIPDGKESEYFSMYEISERGTSWLGPLLFGLAIQYTDSYRIAILSLIVFFILGGIVLAFVNIKKAEEHVVSMFNVQ